MSIGFSPTIVVVAVKKPSHQDFFLKNGGYVWLVKTCRGMTRIEPKS
jgi:hypothetical protein